MPDGDKFYWGMKGTGPLPVRPEDDVREGLRRLCDEWQLSRKAA